MICATRGHRAISAAVVGIGVILLIGLAIGGAGLAGADDATATADTAPTYDLEFAPTDTLAGDQPYAFGIPGPTDQTLGEFFGDDPTTAQPEAAGDGVVYTLTEDGWVQVTADDALHGLQGYVLADTDASARATAAIEQADDGLAQPDQRELAAGVNFVTPTAQGPIDGSTTFQISDGDATQVQNPFAEPTVSAGSETPFSSASVAVGGETVNPFAGYFLVSDSGTYTSTINTGDDQEAANEGLNVDDDDVDPAAFGVAINEAETDDDTVAGSQTTVSAGITNTGDLSGEAEVEFDFTGDDPADVTETVDVAGGETELVTATAAVPDDADETVDVDVTVGEETATATIDVVELDADLEFNDQATASSTVTSDDDTDAGVVVEGVASNVDSGVVVTYEDDDGNLVIAGAEAGSAADLDGTDVAVDIEDTGGFPGEHTAHLIPEEDLSEDDYEPGDTVSDDTDEAVLDAESATVFQGTVEFADQQVEDGIEDDETLAEIDTADLLDGDGDDTAFTVDVHPTDEEGNLVVGEFVGSSDVVTGENENVEITAERVPDDGSFNEFPIEETDEYVAMIHLVDDGSEAGEDASPDDFPLLPNADAEVGFVPGGVTDDATVTTDDSDLEGLELAIAGQTDSVTIGVDETESYTVTATFADGETDVTDDVDVSFDGDAHDGVSIDNDANTITGNIDDASATLIATKDGVEDTIDVAVADDPESDVSIEHNPGSATASTPIDEGRAYAEQLDVFVETDDAIQFGGDADRTLRVVDPDSDATVTYTPTDDAQTVPLDEIHRLGIQNVGTGDPGDEILPFPDSGSDLGSENIDATVEGDTSIYTDGTFSEYVIELVGEDGTVLDSTAPRLVGMGYEATLEQEDHTASVTRDSAVDADWTVEFSLVGDDPELPPREDIIDTVEVQHTDDDDQFDIPLEELEAEAGEYSWTLTVVDEERADVDRERIIRVSSLGDEDILGPVTIDDDDTAADPDTSIEHSGGVARGGGFEHHLVGEQLNIATTDDTEITFGADVETSFEIVNTDGDTVAIESASDTSNTLTTDRMNFDIYDGDGQIRDSPQLTNGESVSVSVSGDVDMFSEGVADTPEDTSDPFDEYEVRYLDADGNIIDTTNQRQIGIGYNIGHGTTQDSSTGEITFTIPRESLNNGISDDWDAEFQLDDDQPAIDLTEEVPNEGSADGDFEFTIDVTELDSGTYSSALTLFDPDQNLGGLPIIGAFEVENIAIKQTLLGELTAEDVTTADTEQTLTADVRDVRPDDNSDARSTDRLVIDYFPGFAVDLDDVEQNNIELQVADGGSTIDVSEITTAPDEGVIIIELENDLEDDIDVDDEFEITVSNIEFTDGDPRVDLGLADGPVDPDDGFRDPNVYHSVRDEFVISEN